MSADFCHRQLYATEKGKVKKESKEDVTTIAAGVPDLLQVPLVKKVTSQPHHAWLSQEFFILFCLF